MGKTEKSQPAKPNFQSMFKVDVPRGRNGKHKGVVTKILSDLEHLEQGRALKIALSELPDTKENVRSALNRATKQFGLEVATSSDNEFLYVWNVDENAK